MAADNNAALIPLTPTGSFSAKLGDHLADGVTSTALGFKNDGSLNTAAMVSAALAKLTPGKRIDWIPGIYVVDDIVQFAGLGRLFSRARGDVEFRQTANFKPFFDYFGGDGFDHEGGLFNYVGTRIDNTNKNTLQPYGGAIPYNAGVHQTKGDRLRVVGARFKGFYCWIGVNGDGTDATKQGVIKGLETKRNRAADGEQFHFGIMARRFVDADIRENIGENCSAWTSDPPHLVYITDRTGIMAKRAVIADNRDTGGNSSAIKVRNINGLKMYSNIVDGNGRGLEVQLGQDIEIFSNTIKNMHQNGTDTQSVCIGLSDVTKARTHDNDIHILSTADMCAFAIAETNVEDGTSYMVDFESHDDRIEYDQYAANTYVRAANGYIRMDNAQKVVFERTKFVNGGDLLAGRAFSIRSGDDITVRDPRLRCASSVTNLNRCIEVFAPVTNAVLDLNPTRWSPSASVANMVTDASATATVRDFTPGKPSFLTYDTVNSRLGVGNASPAAPVDIVADASGFIQRLARNATQFIRAFGDSSGTGWKSLSSASSAKEMIWDSTTDDANTAVSGGNIGFVWRFLGVNKLKFNPTDGLTPAANNGISMGTASLRWLGAFFTNLYLGSAANQITYGAAAPTTGTWKQGDKVINSTPAVGAPKGWVCTVAGTPGTWVSEGNL